MNIPSFNFMDHIMRGPPVHGPPMPPSMLASMSLPPMPFMVPDLVPRINDMHMAIFKDVPAPPPPFLPVVQPDFPTPPVRVMAVPDLSQQQANLEHVATLPSAVQQDAHVVDHCMDQCAQNALMVLDAMDADDPNLRIVGAAHVALNQTLCENKCKE